MNDDVIFSGFDSEFTLLLERGPGRDRLGERIRRDLLRADSLHRGRAGVRQVRVRHQRRRRRTTPHRVSEVRGRGENTEKRRVHVKSQKSHDDIIVIILGKWRTLHLSGCPVHRVC